MGTLYYAIGQSQELAVSLGKGWSCNSDWYFLEGTFNNLVELEHALNLNTNHEHIQQLASDLWKLKPPLRILHEECVSSLAGSRKIMIRQGHHWYPNDGTYLSEHLFGYEDENKSMGFYLYGHENEDLNDCVSNDENLI